MRRALRGALLSLSLSLSLSFLVCSCNGFRKPFKTSLDVIHGQVQGLRVTLREICKPTVELCAQNEENPCEALEKCFKMRTRALLVLQAAEQSVKVGYQSLQVASTDDEMQAVAQAIGFATQNIGEIIVLVQEFKEEF